MIQKSKLDSEESMRKVIEIKMVKKLPIGFIMNKRAATPEGTKIAAGDGDLVLTSVLRNPDLNKAKEKGVKAAVILEAGIPVIGLIQMPDYLMVNSKDREIEKFNVSLMREQVKSLLKATIMVDRTAKKQLGKSDGYSFLYGRTW